MDKPITHQIYDTALELLNTHQKGVRWSELNALIQKKHKSFHPKTINGCIWRLVEKYPDQVYKPQKGLFRLLKYK